MNKMTPITVLMLDEPIHDDLHPYCRDMSCPCHNDVELMLKHITMPLYHGLLTIQEAHRLYGGQQILAEELVTDYRGY